MQITVDQVIFMIFAIFFCTFFFVFSFPYVLAHLTMSPSYFELAWIGCRYQLILPAVTRTLAKKHNYRIISQEG